MGEPSLCDLCTDPGRCCRSFVISRPDDAGPRTWWTDGVGHVRLWLAEHGLPFVVAGVRGTWRDDKSGREYASYDLACPKLEDGRCTIYDRRPDICRQYEPASSGLCVFHRPRWFDGPPEAAP